MSKINEDHYERMLNALKTISKGYQTTEQLKRNSKKVFGLDYVDALEMAYENIQQLAKEASHGVGSLKPKPICLPIQKH